MAKRDYYEVLGVPKNADADTIKSAYRRLAKQNHPDLNPDDPGAAERLKEINEAYEVLSDDQKRSGYDRFGHQDPTAGGGGGYSAGGFTGGFGFEDIISSFFGGGFGGGARTARPERGEDLRQDIQITLEQAFTGSKQQIKFNRRGVCDDCKGTGAAAGTNVETCPDCRGSGVVRSIQRTILGQMQTQTTCQKCRGSGRIIERPCPNCRGAGQTRVTRTVDMTIHPGAENGQRIVVRGEGEPGVNGGPQGDLYIIINVRPHPAFARRGADLLCSRQIPFTLAALGGELTMQGIDGVTTVHHVKPGAQPGDVLTLPAMGMPVPGAGTRRGACHVTLQVTIPKKLTEKQKDLLRQFDGDGNVGAVVSGGKKKRFG
ncbi:MAG: molecular chaperone DnaJ [Clostridia bacterium]|nr:molecular chaperone DnaJ [Clostridia bacterium]